MRSIRELTVLLAFSLTIAAGCGKEAQPGAAEPGKGPAGAKTATPPPVKLATPQRQFLTIETVGPADAVETLSLPGRVTFRPQEQAAVGATAAGRVAQVLVRPGELVKAGTALFTIESADAAAARAARQQSAIRLASAEAFFKRQVEMMQKGVGLEVERQEAEARLQEARAEHTRARQAAAVLGPGQGSRVTVRAPAAGVVVSVRAAIGATVAPGSEALIELGDPNRLQVVAQVPERDAPRIAAGQDAEVALPAIATRIAAKVENFSPRVDPESRRAQVYLALVKPVAGLRAGMLAQVAVRVGVETGITVPVTAVLIKGGRRRVVYVERPDGTFESRDVQIGRNDNGIVVIRKGLAAGEKVVVRGALLLDSQAEQLL